MDNFRAVYHILSELEKALDSPKVDISRCDAEQLGVSENRWCSYIEMILNDPVKMVYRSTDKIYKELSEKYTDFDDYKTRKNVWTKFQIELNERTAEYYGMKFEVIECGE